MATLLLSHEAHYMKKYLDYAASAPILPEVKKWVISHLDYYGNPSSVHDDGYRTRNIVETAREIIADYIGCEARDLVFTSGATESNTLAIMGARGICDSLIISAIEHSSIGECADSGIYESIFVAPVDRMGFVDLIELEGLLQSAKSPLVCIQWANNEIGTIQYISTIADIVHAYDGILFVDATQILPWLHAMIGKVDLSKVDMLSASAHKCGGLPGTGILYRRHDIELSPLVYGHQERGLIGGTENWIGIGAFGEAILHQPTVSEGMMVFSSRDRLWNELKNRIPVIECNGPDFATMRVPNNLSVTIPGLNGQVATAALGFSGWRCSTGSACNAAGYGSPVLRAIKQSESETLRFSIGKHFTLKDAQQLAEEVYTIYQNYAEIL